MNSDESLALRKPQEMSARTLWLGGTLTALVLWGIVYSQLVPFSA